MSEPITIDFHMPAKWKAHHFWKIGGGGAAGFTIALGPVFAVGVELINHPDTKGFGVYVGPCWIAYARYRPTEGPSSFQR